MLDIDNKPAEVRLLYADAAVSHGINGAQRLYTQASNKKNQLTGETLQQSFRRHRIGAYMAQNWIPLEDRKKTESEFIALEGWINRLTKVEQAAGIVTKGKNSTIDHLILDRPEAVNTWFKRPMWDPSVAELLQDKKSTGLLTLPLLSIQLYKPSLVNVSNNKSNTDNIRAQIGEKFGITPSRLALLNPVLHDEIKTPTQKSKQRKNTSTSREKFLPVASAPNN